MRYRYREENEMKDSGVEWLGKIPKDWEVKRNRHIFDFRRREVNESEDTTVLSLTTSGVKIKEDLSFGKSTESYIGHQLVYPGDIVFTPRDFDQTPILSGVSKYYGCISNLYFVLKCKSNISNYFVDYFWWGLKYKVDFFKNFSYGIRYGYNYDQFKDLLFLNPSYIEQEKIANFLDKKTSQFDLIISKKEELIQRLEEAKKSLISEVVTGKVKVVKSDDGYELVKRSSEEMKDSKVEWLGDIPKDWDVKRLRFLGKLQNGISKSSDQFGFGYPFISYGNVYKNIELPQSVEGLVNSTDEERNIYSVKENDVFFTRTSETVEEIGFASTCMKSIENATFAGFLIRFRPNDERLYKGFSKYYFRCDLNRKYFVKEMNLVTRASLSQNLLNNLAVTLPKYEEQIDIYNALEIKIGGVNLAIEKLKYQIEKLKEAKQSLISEAVTGKIEILY